MHCLSIQVKWAFWHGSKWSLNCKEPFCRFFIMPLPSIIGSMEKKGWEFIRNKLTSSFIRLLSSRDKKSIADMWKAIKYSQSTGLSVLGITTQSTSSTKIRSSINSMSRRNNTRMKSATWHRAKRSCKRMICRISGEIRFHQIVTRYSMVEIPPWNFILKWPAVLKDPEYTTQSGYCVRVLVKIEPRSAPGNPLGKFC